MVRGQRGTGKSKLVLSVAREQAADQPLVTLYGELFAYEDTRPYKLFVEALRRTLLAWPAHQLAQFLMDLGDLSRPLMALIPELQPSLSAFTASDVDCRQLDEAICETLRLMTDDGPVILMLDGVQWADAASLRLLDWLARQRVSKLFIVAIYRSEDVDQDHPLRHTFAALESWIDDQLHILPLGPIEVHQMALTLNAQVPSDFGLWLYGATEGNPLHIEQLIQAYLGGPSETRHPQERSTGMALDDAILRRLERLPNGALVALRQAAVLGHSFPFERLRAALDLPEVQVLDYLDTALQADLILGHPTEDRYSFGHPLIREVIYTEMLGGVRKRYHWRAAYVLEQEGVAGLLDEKVDVLAFHFLHSDEHEKALAYLARAIRRARQLQANQVAIEYINQALAVVERLTRTATSEHEREQRRKQREDLLTARANLEPDTAS
jgi:predicted ATPase